MPETKKRGHERSQEVDRSKGRDLKQREYRDDKGNIHHHTRKYEEQHKGKED